MRTKFRYALLAAAAMAATAPAWAQPASPPPAATPPAANAPAAGPDGRGPGAMFDRIDANKDDKVTWDEAWGFVQGRFRSADTDRDGALTRQEADALRPTGGRRGGGPQGGNAAPSAEQSARMSRFGDMMFRGVDANRDGRVTLDEVRPMVEARFRGLDANADNAVARSEVPQRRSGGGGGGGRSNGGPAQGQTQAPPATPR